MNLINEIRLEQMNLEKWCTFKAILKQSDLNNYLSRFTPSHFNQLDFDGDFFWYCIEYKMRIAGSLWFDLESKESVRLGIYLFSDYRGKGIGKEALDLSLGKLREAPSIKKLHLNVRNENIKAINFYKKFGFVENGEGHKKNGLPFYKMIMQIE